MGGEEEKRLTDPGRGAAMWKTPVIPPNTPLNESGLDKSINAKSRLSLNKENLT